MGAARICLAHAAYAVSLPCSEGRVGRSSSLAMVATRALRPRRVNRTPPTPTRLDVDDEDEFSAALRAGPYHPQGVIYVEGLCRAVQRRTMRRRRLCRGSRAQVGSEAARVDCRRGVGVRCDGAGQVVAADDAAARGDATLEVEEGHCDKPRFHLNQGASEGTWQGETPGVSFVYHTKRKVAVFESPPATERRSPASTRSTAPR